MADLKLYDNQSSPIIATIFTAVAGITLVSGIIVHTAIFKLLKRIPQRPINIMIYPTLVSIKGSIISFQFGPETSCSDFPPQNHQKFDKIKNSDFY